MGILGFFSGKTPTPNVLPPEPKRTPLKQLHLIVHPGNSLGIADDAAERQLLDDIVIRAKALDTRSELAAVLLQMNNEEWKRVHESGAAPNDKIVARYVQELQQALPENVMVLTNTSRVKQYEALVPTFNAIHEGAAARGFTIDPQMRALVYGEMVTQCVPAVATHAAKHFNLADKAVVDVNYTDGVYDQPEHWSKNSIQLAVLEGALGYRNVRYIPLEKKPAA